MEGFEEYVRSRGPISSEPTVTLSKSGLFQFNAGAYDLLGNAEAVRLFYNSRKRQVAFAGADQGEANAYRIRSLGKSGKAVDAKRFIASYGIDASVTRGFKVRQVDEFLVIDLKQGD